VWCGELGREGEGEGEFWIVNDDDADDDDVVKRGEEREIEDLGL
jgi:hypothetical protein